ncbi:MAG: hypothetical protein IPI67_20670 [Myxococcales bacterium]|nr:hypothetical protein [Myxococcales bacterium]
MLRRLDGVLIFALAIGLAGACSATDDASSSSGGAGGAGGAAGSDASAGTAGATNDAGSDGPAPTKTVVVVGPGADPTSKDKFNGPDDPFAKPEVVYPANNIVTPPNMQSLEVHWKPGAGQTLFEIRFESPAIALVIYTGCTPVGGGCVYQTDKDFWSQLVEPNRGAPPISYRVRGVNGSAPYGVGTSDPRLLAFSKENIIGGLYYWNTSGVIQRYDFGLPNATAEQFMTPPMAGALTCVGCHALSRDGKRMAIGNDIPAPAPFKVYDVATRTPLTADGGVVGGAANFFAFSPNGDRLLYSDGVKTGLQDVNSGAILNPSLIPLGTMPDWSPNGELVVYSKAAAPPPFGFGNPGVSDASLETIKLSGGSWSLPTTLVPYTGQNNYYPSFAPSQKWVAFNRSPSNMDSYSAGPPSGDGELWAVPTAGGKAVRLDAANQGGSCSWAKWAPDVGTYYNGTIMWLTLSSARAYGLRLPQGSKVQLWMAAFDPKLGEQGKDPSLPAFWLPFQDIAGGNHIAQWVTTVERQPCTEKSECQVAEDCVNGKCVPVVK